VAALIIVIGFELAKTSVQKILNPTAVTFSVVTICVLAGSIAIKLWLSIFNRTLGKKIHSSALNATAADSRNDCISTGAVLLAGIVEYFTAWRIDGYMGLAVALFILWSGIGLAKETISPLLGESANPELQQAIIETIKAQPKVLGYHDLMVHDYGPGQRFASMHVEMDRNEDPLLCHEIIDELERQCLSLHNVHIVIHYDPVVTDDPELVRVRELVCAVLLRYSEDLSVHDFRMVRGIDHTNLIFDIELPYRLMGEKKAIKRHLNDALAQEQGVTYHTVITFDAES
jgi:cation diffusion facilitator family transporter